MLIDAVDKQFKLNVYIDGSYVIYYSIFSALSKWLDQSIHSGVVLPAKESDQDDLPDLTVYQDFQELLEERFSVNIKNISEIIKKYRDDIGFTISENRFFVIDGVREFNWRYKYFKGYKANRQTTKKRIDQRRAFDYITEILIPKINFEEYFGITILKLDGVEADDIIGVQVKKNRDHKNVIIASDHDYLQLMEYGALQYNLEFNEVTFPLDKFKVESMTPNEYKLAKIIMGDKSDGIPAIMNRTGERGAIKLVQNPELLREKLNGDATIMRQFKINTKLIDFNYIPEDKVLEIEEYVSTVVK